MTPPAAGPPPPAGEVFDNIQALRAVAVGLVVLYHARLLTDLNRSVSFEFGQAGVDIFFVISGFIMAYVVQAKGENDPVLFIKRRLLRIVPLYWLLTLAVFVGAQIVPEMITDGRPTVGVLAKSLLFIPFFNGRHEIHPVVYTGWSLNYEMFFYGLFALCLVLRLRHRNLTLGLVLIGLVIAGLVLKPTDAFGMSYLDQRLLEFAAGIGLCSLALRRQLHLGAVLKWTVAGLIAAAFVCLPLGDLLWPQAPVILRWGLPGMVIVAGAVALERSGAATRRPWLLLIGNASYAIYLSHPFVLKAVGLATAKIGVRGVTAGLALNLAVLALVLGVGIGVHLLLEKPMLGFLRRWTRSDAGSRKSAPLATA